MAAGIFGRKPSRLVINTAIGLFSRALKGLDEGIAIAEEEKVSISDELNQNQAEFEQKQKVLEDNMANSDSDIQRATKIRDNIIALIN